MCLIWIYNNIIIEENMRTAKEEVKSILTNLPDDCSLEDIQYHVYVAEKIKKSLYRVENEGTLSQSMVEEKFAKWTTE